MSGKQLEFGTEAREHMRKGASILARAVKAPGEAPSPIPEEVPRPQDLRKRGAKKLNSQPGLIAL